MTSRLRATGSTFVAFVTLIAALFLLWHTFSPVYDTAFATAGRGPVFFPRILLGIMIALAAAVIVQSLLRRDGDSFDWRRLLPVAFAVAATGVYVYLITAIGYLLASAVFCFVLPLAFGYRRFLAIVLFSALYPAVTWYLFEHVFRIILPKSPWFVSF